MFAININKELANNCLSNTGRLCIIQSSLLKIFAVLLLYDISDIEQRVMLIFILKLTNKQLILSQI